ncbi:MAG TPA: PAS domain-containing protein [Alphaproteobacteria bacterium]|nr:PAS domain-containing protein [Alphaproteobacteria bacterium]
MNKFVGETLPIGDLLDPALGQALAYWDSLRSERPFPSRNDISPSGMKSFLRHVMLIDVSYDPLDFVYRVFGTAIAAAHKEDYTGRSARELEPKAFSDLIWQQYCEALECRAPILHSVLFVTADHCSKYHRLILPLSRDGAKIDKLLAVSVEDGKFWDAVAGDHRE